MLFSFANISISYSQSTFSKERIETAIINFLKSQTNADIEIEIVQNIRPISFVESSVSASLRHNFNDFKGLGFVWIDFIKDGKVISTEQIRVKIRKFRLIPVTTRFVRSGETLSNADFIIKRVDVTNFNESELVLDNSVVGKITKNGIPKDNPLKISDLSNDIIIKKGQIVTIIAQSGAISIKTLGTALQDGGAGDIIRVKRSGQGNIVLTGTVNELGFVLLSNNSISSR
ncbi:MAG TPA: flagellar basal body P-ring formation chaperone FlgA [Candidatus Kapabacteria bacterium]|nr:flagellar basal body P-ring formation chaperone FlgA [Candidatus Kapabacteria bacterium]HPU24012.1 flagellar basal body P-ring formation chaperone FlgA [Candidatus Kapabacteria bacterium]